MDADRVKDALPPEWAARVRVVRAGEATVSVVLDGTGLSETGQKAAERAVQEALADDLGARRLAVAFMGERVKRTIIAIGSGKGGVGKSTLTANLAVALAQAGHKVGVVDADIYGPSQPTLLKTQGLEPTAKEETLQPVTGILGIPMLSMGNLIGPGRALTWRGPMAGRALGQLVEANWGDVETLLVDLPPGTGDVQITMVQRFKPDGALIISTPQDLALIDAARAGQMFEAAEVPILGFVENMAGYVCPHCGEWSDPFGRGGVERAAERLGLPFLGRIPLTLAIRESSDAGELSALQEGPEGEVFRSVAQSLMAAVAKPASPV